MRKPPPRTAWFDCFSGISGDMCLGALVSAGVPLARVREGLGKLPLKGYALGQRKVRRGGLVATKVDVVVTDKGRRRWKDVEGIIAGARLPSALKKKGLDIFAALFEAEGRVHGMPWDAVHLHELGAVDCIVDVMGTLIGLEALGARDVRFSPLNVGGGETPTAHGTMPVPAPVTAELTRGLPVYGTEGPELTTPTGAVLARELASGFGPLPPMRADAVGVGAGSRDLPRRPNVLRLFVGRPAATLEELTVLETNIDDMSPEAFRGGGARRDHHPGHHEKGEARDPLHGPLQAPERAGAHGGPFPGDHDPGRQALQGGAGGSRAVGAEGENTPGDGPGQGG
jgi:uncharacterized protein (TIGR00299 family) protein